MAEAIVQAEIATAGTDDSLNKTTHAAPTIKDIRLLPKPSTFCCSMPTTVIVLPVFHQSPRVSQLGAKRETFGGQTLLSQPTSLPQVPVGRQECTLDLCGPLFQKHPRAVMS